MIPDIANWMLVFARAGGLILMLPLFSAANFPARLRVGFSATLAILIAPALPPLPLSALSFSGLILLLVSEASVGVLMGFVSRIAFFAIDFASGMIAADIGLNTPASFNPFNHEQTQAPGTLLYQLGIMLFLSLDMHHWVIFGFQRSFEFLPIGGAHLRNALFQDVVARTGEIFLIAFQMAGPLVAVAFVLNLVFAILSRAVPQMNVFTEIAGFRCLIGLSVFGMTLNLMAQHISTHLHRIPSSMMKVAQLLGGG